MRSLMSGAVGLLLVGSSALAQVGGDPVKVQFGNYLSPAATLHWEEFEISNGFGFPLPPGFPPIPPQRFSWDYAASPFEGVTPYAIEITSFTFFNNQTRPRSMSTNVFNVFMGVGDGPMSLFGQFFGVSPLCGLTLACVPNCGAISPTCLPLGAGGFGSFVYDPSLGALHIEMIQTLDWAANVLGDPLFYHDEYTPGGPRGLVTRFDGIVAAPEPSTFLLMGTGLLIVAGLARRRRKLLHESEISPAA